MVLLIAAAGVGAAAAAGAFSGGPATGEKAASGRTTSTSVAPTTTSAGSGAGAGAATTTTTPGSRSSTSSTAGAPTTTTVPPTTTTVAATTTTVATLPADEVVVEVLNGTGASGVAGQAAAALHAEGFGVNGTGDAASFEHPVTLVAYPPGEEEAAETVALHVVGNTELEADDDLPAGVVDLVIGSTYEGIGP